MLKHFCSNWNVELERRAFIATSFDPNLHSTTETKVASLNLPEVVIMKSLIRTLVVASTLAAPAIAFAQETQPLTRAQVRNELIELEQAGYDPMTYDYAKSLQDAEAKIARQHERDGQTGSGSKQVMSEADAHSPLNVTRK
ncbi:DUF4148 domain-containing protein [Burkholderia sp. S-53]|uniref:DUF4148 domain-containing protein n=1 Tax=Burkholderia sp. S-53 TaxID=2906514 RepID=UPI0021D12E2A|nr:DUF4148 domain-containing protein [Burkholderia sp. S-53]UXU86273.1 DUF4148 domain-containing protein [Burkholderia sp. S-53]